MGGFGWFALKTGRTIGAEHKGSVFSVDPSRFGIVGGGMLGLAVAHRLRQAGQDVTLFEGAPQVGGLASAWSLGSVLWDRFYHVISPRDQSLMALLGELGLTDEVEWRTTQTAFYANGRHFPLNNAWDYLRLPVLGPIAKARFSLTILYAAYLANPSALERIGLEEWLRRWTGNRGFDRLWLPLVRAKLGDNYRIASASFIQSVIRRFYGAREGGARTERFGFVRGGYARVLERFCADLERRSVLVKTGEKVQKVSSAGSQVEVKTARGSEQFDQVVMTCASPVVDHLCDGMSVVQRNRHRALTYQGVICASLLVRRSLTPAYLTYLVDERIPFTAVIEMTGLVGKEALDGNALVYLPRYVTQDDEYLSLDDDEIRSRFLRALSLLYPAFDIDQVIDCRVARARYVLPVSTVDYRAGLPALDTGAPGLWVLNSALIVNASLSVNEAVELANRHVPDILNGAR